MVTQQMPWCLLEPALACFSLAGLNALITGVVFALDVASGLLCISDFAAGSSVCYVPRGSCEPASDLRLSLGMMRMA